MPDLSPTMRIQPPQIASKVRYLFLRSWPPSFFHAVPFVGCKTLASHTSCQVVFDPARFASISPALLPAPDELRPLQANLDSPRRRSRSSSLSGDEAVSKLATASLPAAIFTAPTLMGFNGLPSSAAALTSSQAAAAPQLPGEEEEEEEFLPESEQYEEDESYYEDEDEAAYQQSGRPSRTPLQQEAEEWEEPSEEKITFLTLRDFRLAHAALRRWYVTVSCCHSVWFLSS
jgi:hypothetical protein